jgi:hypothetical protein
MDEYLAVNMCVAEPQTDRNTTRDFYFYKYSNLFTDIKNSYMRLGMSAAYR